MNHELLQAMRTHSLPAPKREVLYAIATRPPAATTAWLVRGLAMVAALLLGLGLIFWIAANWQTQTRMFKLALVQGAFAVAVLVAVVGPRVRTAALLAATLALGGLLALVGQTYQTGADAWQLFAVWAALSLPWTVLQRSELLWVVWVAIAGLALWLWTGRGGWDLWWREPRWDEIAVNLLAWAPLVVLPMWVGQRGWVHGDQGWATRLAVAMALGFWTSQGVVTVVEWGPPGHATVRVLAGALALGLIGAVAAWAWRVRELPSLALTAVAANVLVVAWLSRVVWELGGEGEGGMALISLLGMAALAVTATGLLRVQRQWREEAA